MKKYKDKYISKLKTFFNIYQVRHYAVAATVSKCAALAPEIKVLNNKVTVAAYDNHAPIAQVSIVFRYLKFK